MSNFVSKISTHGLVLVIFFLLPASARAGGLFSPAALYGADVRSVAVHPEDPDTILAGTAGGHLYLSRDGGGSWVEPKGGQPLLGWVVAGLQFDPNRPGRLWAALWGVWGGGLVAHTDSFSRPGGEVEWEWDEDALPGGQIYSLALVPGREGWLYIGTRHGVYGSRDGGESWRHLTSAFPKMRKVTSLLVDQSNPETVFAGSWQRAYRSDDGGESWRGVFEGMVPDSEVFSLTPVPGRPGEMWASTCGWVYHSLDGGGLWQRRTEGFENRRVPSFAVLPNGRLLAGTVRGLHLSSEVGKSWKRITDEKLAINVISVHPDRPWRVILGTEGSGVWVSKDGGSTFEASTTGMTHLRVVDMVSVEKERGVEILAAVTHAGPAGGIHSSVDGGRTFQQQRGEIPTVLDLAVAGKTVYAATEKGLYERREDYSWHAVKALGTQRVEGVEAREGQVVAWSREAVYQRQEDGQFGKLSGLGAPVRNAAPKGAEERAYPTGDGRYASLQVDARGARLVSTAPGGEVSIVDLDLPIPHPSREVTAAILLGDRLLLSTLGHGVLGADLQELLTDERAEGR